MSALERDVESCLSAALPTVDVREVSILRTGTDAAFASSSTTPRVSTTICASASRARCRPGDWATTSASRCGPRSRAAAGTLAHFETAIGRRVALTVDVGDRRRKREGVLTAVDDRGVTLTGEDGATVYPSPTSARLVISTAMGGGDLMRMQVQVFVE